MNQSDQEKRAAHDQKVSALHERFYRAFEEKYRGSRDLINSRLENYRPFIDLLLKLEPEPSAVDLGCGRGEWIELMGTIGFNAQGVDLDEFMLEACYERNLKARNMDALEFLCSLPDASQSLVTGFHIAEHVPFPYLQNMFAESLRVLKPGGLLIFETPNPENINVSSINFYNDPTHRHPLPPNLLSFLPEHYGFTRNKILRLQENVSLSDASGASLNDVIFNVSPDYAVVSQKAADADTMALFDKAFDAEFGISLPSLVGRFDRQSANVSDGLSKLNEDFHQLAERTNAIYRAISPLFLLRRKLRKFSVGIRAWICMKPHSRPWRMAKRSAQLAYSVSSRNRWIHAKIVYIINHLPRLEGFIRELLHRDFHASRAAEFSFNIRVLSENELSQEESLKNHFFVDVSDIERRKLKTGIQRSAKAILNELIANPPKGYKVIPVQLVQNRTSWELRHAFDHDPDNETTFRQNSFEIETIDVRSGDIYFAPDYFVDGVIYAAQSGLFEKMKAAGVRLHFMIHDNLPLSHPQFFSARSTKMHGLWLETIIKLADSFICVSQTTANSTAHWYKEHFDKSVALPPCFILHHGADIEASRFEGRFTEAEGILLKKATSNTSFLIVGTVEPRKGCAQALSAFERLWDENIDVNLVMIGKEGWDVDELAKLIRSHPQNGSKLFWFEEASDEFLERAYQSCSCLLAASECEGFGLPLIEAAQNNLPILARDTEIFREIAKNSATYFSGEDAESLAEAVHLWKVKFDQGNHIASDALQWITWKQNVERLKILLHLS